MYEHCFYQGTEEVTVGSRGRYFWKNRCHKTCVGRANEMYKICIVLYVLVSSTCFRLGAQMISVQQVRLHRFVFRCFEVAVARTYIRHERTFQMSTHTTKRNETITDIAIAYCHGCLTQPLWCCLLARTRPDEPPRPHPHAGVHDCWSCRARLMEPNLLGGRPTLCLLRQDTRL